MQCSAGRLHICKLGIVYNLSLAYSTDKINVEEACQLELCTKLGTIILLLHVCKRYIDERVDIVVEEVLPVRHILHTRVVTIKIKVQP